MGFLKKLFGSGGKADDLEGLVKDTLEGIIEKSGLDLVYDVNVNEDGEQRVLSVELTGGDEDLMKDRKGQVLDAFQLLLKRVVQHNFPEDKTNITVDSGGYRVETEAALIERAENLKTIAIEQGRSVYYRALPPKDRKVVHQYLAKDPRVKSRSLGEGLYKKIKIYPVKNPEAAVAEDVSQDQ
jgi:spoIIIJ-associated protein